MGGYLQYIFKSLFQVGLNYFFKGIVDKRLILNFKYKLF